jgi:hypothetical protein
MQFWQLMLRCEALTVLDVGGCYGVDVGAALDDASARSWRELKARGCLLDNGLLFNFGCCCLLCFVLLVDVILVL